MVLYMFFLVWILRKCKKREENLEFLIFWTTMFLGEEYEEQSFLTKIFNIFILKLLITKILIYFKIK